MRYKGKALLQIERVGERYVQFEVRAGVRSCTPPHENLQEEFELLATDSLPLPDSAYKLKIGEKIWIDVVFLLVDTRDYWGECDVHLHYLKQRILKRRRANR